MRGAAFRVALAAAWLACGAVRADPPRPMSAQDFIQAAAGSDRFERLEAQVALIEGRDGRVKAFAQEMIGAHTATTQALGRATAAAGLPPPPEGMAGDQAMLLSALQGQSGPDFDKTYARHQVLGHAAALAVEESYATSGDTPAVRSAAVAAVPIIRRHLDEARQLCAALACDP